MGAVVVAAWIIGYRAYVAHVGDARAYRAGALTRLTTDHSWVAEALREGRIRIEQARSHAARHVVTRALGVAGRADVEIDGPIDLGAGDRLLLCSDGLHGVVAESTVSDIVAKWPPADAIPRLIDAANVRGGPDNIGVAVALVP